MAGSNKCAEMYMFMHFNWNEFVDNVTVSLRFVYF